MSEKSRVGEAVFFLSGVGAGLICALLLAPRSGDRIRRLILQRTQEGQDRLRANADRLIDLGKRFVDCGSNPPRAQARTRASHAGADGPETIIETT
jgi:gas vesicle protein